MTTLQLAMLGGVFLAVFGAVLLALNLATRSPVQRRLDTLSETPINVPAEQGAQAPWMTRLVRLATPIAHLSLPEENWDNSVLRLRFINAGYRHASAPVLYFAAKTVLALLLPLLLFLALDSTGKQGAHALLFWLLIAAAGGYYLPNFVLGQLVARRKLDIQDSFPDALDLMTICVEAGLAMDAALARVGGEIGLKSEALAEELNLVTLELRVGGAKEKALRNLALRTGVEDVDALATMLIQAEKFGTSVADSLRVQSDVLRTKRRQRAEEKAAKIGLKLLFPLIFFIFPALLVVLMGPAMIQIYRVLLPGIAGN